MIPDEIDEITQRIHAELRQTGIEEMRKRIEDLSMEQHKGGTAVCAAIEKLRIDVASAMHVIGRLGDRASDLERKTVEQEKRLRRLESNDTKLEALLQFAQDARGMLGALLHHRGLVSPDRSDPL